MTTQKSKQAGTGVAYQRWEPASLNPEEVIKLTTAEAVEQIHQQAHQEGYDAGFAEGKAAGYRQGQQQAAAELQQLKQLIDAVHTASQQFSSQLAEDLLALALDLSQQILRQTLSARPERLIPIVRSAMDSLPQQSQHPHLHLNPQDAELVRLHLQNELTSGGWKLIEDQRIARGGCRIETATVEVDATLPSRWHVLGQALGQDLSWIDE
jgi:flagellar assembly protein FliH